MTRNEVRFALRKMEDSGAYSLRLFLDNRTTVLAHDWFLEEDAAREGQGGDDGPDGGSDGSEGLLRVVVRGRQALIAVSRIVVIELVPFSGY